jgi:hypothetical protein
MKGIVNMKTTIFLTTLAAVAVTLGGCHVFKQAPVARHADVTVTQQTARPAPTLESLDARVSDIEKRMAAARAANARAAVAARTGR